MMKKGIVSCLQLTRYILVDPPGVCVGRGACATNDVIRLVDGRTDGFAYWIANIQYLGKVRGNDFM